MFTVLVSFLLVIMFFYLVFYKTLSFLPMIALTLILCGGTGNLIDRIFYDGIVIDMFIN